MALARDNAMARHRLALVINANWACSGLLSSAHFAQR